MELVSTAYALPQARLRQEPQESSRERPHVSGNRRPELLLEAFAYHVDAEGVGKQPKPFGDALERIFCKKAKTPVDVRHHHRARAGVVTPARGQAGVEPLAVFLCEPRRWRWRLGFPRYWWRLPPWLGRLWRSRWFGLWRGPIGRAAGKALQADQRVARATQLPKCEPAK